jgi:lysophospholipase L1-like esterase
MHNKKKAKHSKKHSIILIGDSNIKGYASNLKLLLSNNYGFYSVTKPGSTTIELKESAKEEASQLCHNDVLIICSGTNDYEQNKFDQTFINIRNFVQRNDHTNIMLMNIPY